jgi:hypothetical protein
MIAASERGKDDARTDQNREPVDEPCPEAVAWRVPGEAQQARVAASGGAPEERSGEAV